MRVKIVDLLKFEETNATYFTRDINFIYEYEVLAIRDSLNSSFFKVNNKPQKEYLILLSINYETHRLMWCKNDNSLEVINDEINKDWINTKKYKYHSKDDIQTLVYTNVYSPIWMIEDNKFFYDIIENQQIALEKFKLKVN